ncbi:MAG: hypothetical protein A2231_02145 [Candidatus Firestonebacteria bacterium RIFOXYA2_FULL_40_8]|nr:MAG: hypothetical protein A2231_02145 [Candidatus Firestonebacteria bacterium RIFOXYA2_FULL_40_8]
MFLVASILFLTSFAAAELSEKAKEAIEKARQQKEADAKTKEAFNAKTASSSVNIPNKLVYMGTVDRTDTKNARTTTIVIKLKNGTTINVPFGPIFTREGKPLTINNVLSGMPVAIVNDIPTISKGWVGGTAATNLPCTIEPTTKIYCGSDASNLKKYYPDPKKK